MVLQNFLNYFQILLSDSYYLNTHVWTFHEFFSYPILRNETRNFFSCSIIFKAIIDIKISQSWNLLFFKTYIRKFNTLHVYRFTGLA